MCGKLFDPKDIPSEYRQYFTEVEVQCGKPWVRVVEKGKIQEHPDRMNRTDDAKQFHKDENEYGEGGSLGRMRINSTLGWQPTCTCGGDPVPCTVLDPFGGSGTTAEVAISHGRRAILIELKPEYVTMIHKRVAPALELARQERIAL